MPDTPRTTDELLAAFADNSTGDISAQDLRDFVVSVPWGPDDDNVAVIAFPTMNGIADDTWAIQTANASPTSYDPGGWLGTEDYDDDQLWSGGVLTARQYMVLPEGVYQIQASTFFGSAVGNAVLGLGMADKRVSQDESLDPMVLFSPGNESEQPAVWGVNVSSTARTGNHQFLRVKRSLAPEHFAFVLRHRSGGSKDLSAASIAIMRISSSVPS